MRTLEKRIRRQSDLRIGYFVSSPHMFKVAPLMYTTRFGQTARVSQWHKPVLHDECRVLTAIIERRQFDVDDQLPLANLATACRSPDSRHGRIVGVGDFIVRHRSACTMSDLRVCCSSRTPPKSGVPSATAKEIMFGGLNQCHQPHVHGL